MQVRIFHLIVLCLHMIYHYKQYWSITHFWAYFWIGLIFGLCITHFSCKNSFKGKSGKRVGITFDKFNFKIKNILNIFLVNFFSAFAIYSQKDVKKILLKFFIAKNNSPNFIFDTRIVFLGSTPCTRMKMENENLIKKMLFENSSISYI